MAVAEAEISNLGIIPPTIVSIPRSLFEVEVRTTPRKVVNFVDTTPSWAREHGEKLGQMAEEFMFQTYSRWHQDTAKPYLTDIQRIMNSGARLATRIAQIGLDRLPLSIFDNVRIGSYALDPTSKRVTKIRSNLRVDQRYEDEVHRSVVDKTITLWDDDLQSPSIPAVESVAMHRRRTGESTFSERGDDPIENDEYADTLGYIRNVAYAYGEQTDPHTHALQLIVDTDPYMLNAQKLDCIPLTSSLYWSIIKTLADLTKEQETITIPMHITTLGKRHHFRLQVARSVLPQLLMYACFNTMQDDEVFLGMTKVRTDLLALTKSGPFSPTVESIIEDTHVAFAQWTAESNHID